MTTQARELAGIISNAGDLNFSDDITLGSDASVLNFGADSEVTVTHVHNTGLLVNSTRQLQFGDSGTYINQSGDGVLNLTSDTEIELNATTLDINANVDISGTLTVAGALDFGDLDISNVGSIALDTITNDGTDLTLDSSGDIIFDADGKDIILKDGGTEFGRLKTSASPDHFYIKSAISDNDLIFQGNDGGSAITALTLDMSEAGKAAFNAGATFGNMVSVTTTGVDYKVIRAYDGTYNVSMGRDAIAAYNGDTEVDLYVGRGAQDVIISSGSKLGIGDTSPRSTLHVVGNITINASSNAPYIDFVEHGATDDPKARIAMDQISGTDGQLIFYTEDSGTLAEKLRIADAGQIGIGGANYGTDGQLLTSTGASTAPAWEDAPSSGIGIGKAIVMAMVFGG